MPIQFIPFTDRLEVRGPGGLYGRLRVDQPGKAQPDARSPVLAAALALPDKPGSARRRHVAVKRW